MGQFKPMVKMMTTEPTVELKLKKGGHVSGHSAMKSTMPMEERDEKHVAYGKSPKKPSIMERRKSMSGAMLNSKKGGVAKKADGGMMGPPTGAPSGAMMTPAMKRALMMRMAAQRGAMRPGMAAPAAPMAPAMKKGGKAEGSKMDKAQDKAMIMKAFKEHDAQEHKGGKGTKLKLKNGGTTKVVDGDKKDTAHGTGMIKMGKPGGYAAGGTIEGNEGKFKNTKVVDGDKNDSAHGTGGVRMANAGGFKRGGNIMKKAEGGSTNWENRPADTAHPGKTNTKTGEVKESNAGGYKKGGAAKKHFATGGSVNDAGHAVAMPRKPVSRPVANSLQSGTFKKGGKVVHKAEGGMPMADDGYDPGIAREARRRDAEQESIRRENEATPVMDSVKRLLGIRPNAGAGRGFVNPTMTRKAGGRAC